MDLVGKRYWFFLVSALVIVPGIISLMIPPALKPGIEFTSGSALTVTFDKPVTESQVREQLDKLGIAGATVQKMGDRGVFIRMPQLKEAVLNPDGTVKEPSQRQQLEDALTQNVAAMESKSFDTVSPVVARETVRNAAIALVAASIAILLYITWAFRKIPKSFRYGVCTVVSLIHDLVLVLGVFSILGKTMNMEVNSMFIVGLLTVLGYSDNNVIVVLDRIRENVLRNPEQSLESMVNKSLWETLARSLNTTIATLITLVALILLGGPTLRPLLIVLLVGFVAGTYSSVFVAAQLLVVWEKGEFRKIGRIFRLLPARKQQGAQPVKQ